MVYKKSKLLDINNRFSGVVDRSFKNCRVCKNEGYFPNRRMVEAYKVLDMDFPPKPAKMPQGSRYTTYKRK